MNPAGSFHGNTLTISWSPIPEASDYALAVERCDESRCSRVWTSEIRAGGKNEIQASSMDFGPCTAYNLEISAYSRTNARFRVKETSPLRKECPQWGILFASIGISAVFVICGLIALFFYRRKYNITEIQRARSKVYTRIYTKDKYERSFDQEEFCKKVPDLLTELDKESNSNLTLEEGRLIESYDEGSNLAKEFRSLEILSFDTIQRRTRVADSAINRKRNRYQDVVPFDSTRVKLEKPMTIEDETGCSDYINASYISGFISVYSTSTSRIRGDSCISSNSSSNGINKNQYNSSCPPLKCRNYIAAQGPGVATTPLFWEMIWQHNVRIIVMLTNCVEGYGFNAVKCSMYWPHLVGAERKFHNVQVQLYDVQEAPDYTIRKFDVSNVSSTSSGNREIVQIQYNAWPDRTAPSDPKDLIQLIQVTRALTTMYNNTDYPGPILVHCSAGVGRSGTYIAVDQLTRMIDCDKNSKIDIFHSVYQLRRDRRHMVQTLSQYAYVYKCVLTYLNNKRKEANEKTSSIE
ncbi:receptor-type tyrosine-protein phosphatase C [Lepeophtheirus salmonis]|uniref:receptor-type tyrosine-protein phosphatase C n=1 Tax=Lepeophtheirus salmonis TaxID=72036 RepID=UPI001AE8D238|nr:receptor-type tyrosine-protein phosphatase C-like [Lepeophtheirus salmonis]